MDGPIGSLPDSILQPRSLPPVWIIAPIGRLPTRIFVPCCCGYHQYTLLSKQKNYESIADQFEFHCTVGQPVGVIYATHARRRFRSTCRSRLRCLLIQTSQAAWGVACSIRDATSCDPYPCRQTACRLNINCSRWIELSGTAALSVETKSLPMSGRVFVPATRCLTAIQIIAKYSGRPINGQRYCGIDILRTRCCYTISRVNIWSESSWF